MQNNNNEYYHLFNQDEDMEEINTSVKDKEVSKSKEVIEKPVLNSPKITKKKLNRLIRLMSMQAPSENRINGNSEAQHLIAQEVLNIYGEVKGEKSLNNLKVEIDDYGNYYITKGKGLKRGEGQVGQSVYPTYVAHLDQVESAIAEEYKIYQHGDVIFAFGYSGKGYNAGYGQVGTGGDDLCGVWLCLEMLLAKPSVKIALYQNEEVGLLGSEFSFKHMREWYKNCSFLLQGDRNQANNDFISKGSWTNLQSKVFKEKVGKFLPYYDYKDCTTGGSTDVVGLVKSGIGICAANVACGYHSAHRRNEIVSIKQVFNCLDLFIRIYDEMGDRRWVLKKETSKHTNLPNPYSRNMTSSRGGGYNGHNHTRNLNQDAVSRHMQKAFNKNIISLGVGKHTFISEYYLNNVVIPKHTLVTNCSKFEDLPTLYEAGKKFSYIKFKDDLYFKVSQVPNNVISPIKITRLRSRKIKALIRENIQDYVSFTGDYKGYLEEFKASGEKDIFETLNLYSQKPKVVTSFGEDLGESILFDQGYKRFDRLPPFGTLDTRLTTSNRNGFLFLVSYKDKRYEFKKIDLNLMDAGKLEAFEKILVSTALDETEEDEEGPILPTGESDDCPCCEEFDTLEEYKGNNGWFCHNCNFTMSSEEKYNYDILVEGSESQKKELNRLIKNCDFHLTH